MPAPALQLQAIEAQLLHQWNDLLVESVVDAAADSSIILFEYPRLSSQTHAHLAVGAQRRANRAKEEQDRRYELEKRHADLQGSLSEIRDECRWGITVMQNQHLKDMSELKSKQEAEVVELRELLNLAAGERNSLVTEREHLHTELLNN